MKHLVLEELLWQPFNHYARNFNISKMFKDVSNAKQNFMFMRATGFEIVGGGGSGRASSHGIRCGYQKAWYKKG